MNKILDFIKEEVNANIEEKSKLEAQIHRMIIDMEFVEKAIVKISNEKDNTHDIFSLTASNGGFSSKELRHLKKQKLELNEAIDIHSQKINMIDKKLERLNSLLQESEQTCGKCKSVNSDISSLTILEVQEEERQRIARDIHDSVVQNMTALVHKSEFVMKVMDSDAQRAKLELELINKVTRECIDELRKIIFDLRPMSIDDLGLKATLRKCKEQLDSSTDMQIQLNFRGDDSNIPQLVSVNVLRMIQEICSNSIKHSGGTQIVIDVEITDNCINITQSDNGHGFKENNDNELLLKNGFGLPMLKERLLLLNGKMKLQNNVNEGVRYMIQIPFVSKEIQ